MTELEITQGTRAIVTEGSPSGGVQLRRSNFRKSAQGREVVIVLGMHRSGTSLLANVLHLLGVDMLDQPTYASAKNQTGFWERQDIVALHDEILGVLNVPIGSPAHAIPFAPGWWRSVEIKPQKKKLRDLVAGHLEQVRRPWGFKDPRTCRLLPLWGEILEELDVSPRFVWAVRHPAESSLSMSLKNPQHRPIPVPQSEVMWLAYNYDILRYVGRHWPIIVPYDAWFDDAMALAHDLGRELDLIWQGSDHELDAALSALIHREHRHHWVKEQKLRCSIGLADELYRSILSIRDEPDAGNGEAALVPLQSLFGAVQPFVAEARDVKPLKEENLRLEKDIADLRAALEETSSQVTALQQSELAREARANLLAGEASAARDALEAERSAAAVEVSRLKTARTDAEEQLISMRSENQRLRNDLRVAELDRQDAQHRSSNALLSLGGERDALLSSLNTTRSLFEDGKATTLELSRNLSAVTTERDALQASLSAANRKLDSFRNQLSAAASAQSALQGSFAEASAEREQLRHQLGTAAEREQQLQSDHAAAIKKLEAFRTLLAQGSAAQEALKAQLATTAEERDSAQKGLVEANATLDELLKDAAVANRKLESYRAQLIEVSAAHATSQEELQHLSSERDLLKAGLESKVIAYEALERAGNDLASQRDVLLGQLKLVTDERDAMNASLADLSGRHESVQSALDVASAARDDLHAEYMKTTAERDRLQNSLKAAHDAFDALHKDHSALSIERQSLRADVSAAKAAEEELRREIEVLTGANVSLRSDVQAANTTSRTQLEAAALLRRDVEQLKGELAAMRRTLRDERERHAEALHGLPGDLSRTKPLPAPDTRRHTGQVRPD